MSAEKPTDPNVKIPPAARAAAAHAEEIHKQAYGKVETPAEPPVVESPPTQAEPPAAPEPPKVTSVGNQEASWEHRYNSMKGRFDRASDQIRNMQEQITNLQGLIATMQTAPKETPRELQQRLLTPEEVQNYGEDLLNVVGKRAKEELSPEVAAMRKEIADLKSKLAGVGQAVVQDAQTRMFDTLDRTLPNWREINQSPDFMSWLGLQDLFSGDIRLDLLRRAFERNDAPRVLAFFKGFLAESEAAQAPASSAKPDTGIQKVPLDALAAPGRAKSAATSSPAEKPIISSADITKFYADKAAGRYRGREDEASAIERDIFQATRERRIRN